MSGLAVTSFVLSLVFILVAVPGVWISQLIPLGLGVLALFTVKASERRGRALAVWAIVIALGAGSCSYTMHNGMRSVLGHMGESLLSALSAKVPDDERDAALKPWMYAPALEKDPELLATIRKRYAATQEALGSYKGAVELGTPLLGFFPLFVPPKGVKEIGTGEAPPAWEPGAVVWVTVPFERGAAHMAILLQGGERDSVQGLGELQPGGQAAIVGDLRFFRAAAEQGP
jgi:hypothetical protein